MQKIPHFIGGKRVHREGARRGEVFNPALGEAVALVPFASATEVEEVVRVARDAQAGWARVNPQRRARVFRRFVDLLDRHMDELAEMLSREHGKTLGDSRGDIQRGLEVCEHVCGAPELLKGEFTSGAGAGIDMYSMRQPLGVGVGITPFNFPAMIPMWMFAPAIACGNAFVLKPSERDPSVTVRLAELMLEAGLPPGVLNVLHGDREAVDALCAAPDVGAVAFVGSTPVAKAVYAAATGAGKRAQCFGGAKNHMIIMPDADLDQAADALIGSAYGSAGERCMAISVAVPVGADTADRLVDKLAPRVESLRVGPYGEGDGIDFGPLVAESALNRVTRLIESGVAQGAELRVDGRGCRLQGYEGGYFIGGCLFDRVRPEMDIYREEIFGPVLSVVRAADYEEALSLPMSNAYGNGVAIFTRDGDTARDFAARVNIGMVGVNVPIPVPLAYYTFGGWKDSMFGDLNQHGPDAFRFWTRTKTVTSRWPTGVRSGADFNIPVL